MLVGSLLTLAALVILVAGLVGRRRSQEPRRVLTIRIGLFVALLITGVAGMAAGHGARDLLMLHLPLAFIIMGMAANLMHQAGSEPAQKL